MLAIGIENMYTPSSVFCLQTLYFSGDFPSPWLGSFPVKYRLKLQYNSNAIVFRPYLEIMEEKNPKHPK